MNPTMRHLTAALLILSLSISSTQAALGPSVVVDWLNQAQTLVRTYAIPNQLAARYYGLLGLSIYKALQLAEKNQSANQTAVAAVAAHALLDTWFPWTYNQNDLLISRQLVGISDADLATAKRYGQAAAKAVSSARIGDGFATWSNFKPFPANVSSSYGHYQFTPGQVFALYPQLGDSTPLVLGKNDITTLSAPFISNWTNYIFSDEYYADLAYVAQYGGQNGSAVRSAYDNITPAFWADGGNTSTIGGHLINVTYQVLPSSLSIKQQAHFYARLGAAVADASIAAWKVKYSVLEWRPITAIRQPDGSTGRYTPDPTWSPFLSTPAHPSYPSGHQATVGAWLAVTLHQLNQTVGSDNISATIGSEGGSFAPRTYSSLSALAYEVGVSRQLAGVHFPRDNADGLALGVSVGKRVLKKI